MKDHCISGFSRNILACLGKFPEKTDLDLKIESTEKKSGYTRQLVSYNVEKNERVHAILLIPAGSAGQRPGILALHQHAGQWHLGKSEVAGMAGDPMYAYGLELCLRGYVVLCPDHLCFEERIPPFFRRTPETLQHYERFAFCKYIQDGGCLQTKYLHDISVGLDLLTNFPFVDDDKIGVIGHSLGGQEALWTAWFDERVKAAVSSCGFGKVSTIFRDHVLHNLALYIPGMAQYGDTDDLLMQIAPRPFAMTAGIKDAIFPIDGVKEIVHKVKEKYEEFGKSENFLPIIFDGGHGFPDDIKEQIYSWLDDILKPA